MPALAPRQVNDLGSALAEGVGHIARFSQRLEKNIGRHRELEPAPADFVGNMKGLVPKRDLRDSGNIENSIQFASGHSTPRFSLTTERTKSVLPKLNTKLRRAPRISYPAEIAA